MFSKWKCPQITWPAAEKTHGMDHWCRMQQAIRKKQDLEKACLSPAREQRWEEASDPIRKVDKTNRHGIERAKD